MRRLKRRKKLEPATESETPRRGKRRESPERRCVATGAVIAPDQGLRFVLSPDGELAPDFSAKLPGRGAWLTSSKSALETALQKGAFAKSFKTGVKAPGDLAERVEAGLVKAALSALGLARRTGNVVVGFEKVRASLTAKMSAALVNAADGGEDGRRKLTAMAGAASVIELFTEAELAAALGREEPTVHAAIKAGPSAQRFLREARRLEGFRNG